MRTVDFTPAVRDASPRCRRGGASPGL